ncbi:hypothetical protein E2C01_016747 [Portunus trituberculatus]|uniref:Uncharacterized protein n=1 Tax=Portunus trituberculatus TaxID=210409 RepID=A0A5B7DQM8_PORTR|nr:hypothetical protein [Portunus trituberculatus]
MNLSLAKFTFDGRVATDHRVHAWRFESKLGGRTANHVAPHVGTNSADLLPTWPLPAQQVVPVGLRTMVVASRMKVGEGKG